ncbi:hypothetical protein DL93DRAFT_1037867 [Clavulina sp. PMI_390]|nr:hypothetical protein DL93DRAFT_1037867 [Clavulina sp. PMI_390]
MIPETNPVISSARHVYQGSTAVRLNDAKIASTAADIHAKMLAEHYSPRTWRTHPLHLTPPETISSISDPAARPVLDWIFLISSLNFSFWSERDESSRFSVTWRESWDQNSAPRRWTGYWSLVAALDRALEAGIPITDPAFYSSPEQCPDSTIGGVFRSASSETIALLSDRIKIMREVGNILVSQYEGSFQVFLARFQEKHSGNGTALELVEAVLATFPSFRDELVVRGRKVCFWKRAQILVAEVWAAFYPLSDLIPHPILPHGVDQLTMFADYRVPHLLEQMGTIEYSEELQDALMRNQLLAPGSELEISIRAASILAVERIKADLLQLQADEPRSAQIRINSVLIDFWLWDLAKWMGNSHENLTALGLPHHRTRSICFLRARPVALAVYASFLS